MEVISYILTTTSSQSRHCNKLSGGKNGEIIGTKLTDFNTAVCTAVIKDQQKKLTREQSTLLLNLLMECQEKSPG